MNSLANYKYTEAEQKQILKNIVVLIDSREKVNGHITEWLNKKNIKYKSQALDFGDYSFMVPAMPELGISRDLYFDKQIVCERKNSLEELSQNLAQSREQFNNEFLRAGDCKKVLVIERGNMEDILTGSYGTKFNSASYFGSLISFQHRYGLNIHFVGKEYIGQFIYCQFYYFLREFLG